jgi:epoxyqueuosine reductase QueG
MDARTLTAFPGNIGARRNQRALLGDYEMDARKRISYLTIEAEEERPKELQEKTGGRAVRV